TSRPMRHPLLLLVLTAAFAAACSSEAPGALDLPPEQTDAGTGDTGETGETGDDAGTGGEAPDAGAVETGDAGGDAPDAGVEPEPVIRFVAIGDTGTAGTDQHRVAAAMLKKCAASGCDFAVMLGDNFYETGVSGADDPQWKSKFEEPYAALDFPFYAVLGNHDYGGGGAGNEFGKGKHQVAYAAKSTKWKMPSEYYRFRQKHAEFFAMDTNMQMYGLDSKQETDMLQWLKDSTADWKIMLGHHPYLSNGKHGNAGEYDGAKLVPIANGAGVKSFAEKIWCGRADLYLCGHDHSRQYLGATCKGTELAVSGAGAKVTTLPGKNPSHFQAATLGFMWIEIKGRSLTAEFVDVNGNVEYTRTVRK
ncbi:MAG: metallophosphoesterase, partial [Myxococcales bacterium]